METGFNAEPVEKGEALRKRHGGGGRGVAAPPVAGKVDPFVPRSEHSPRELRSWAKRTGFVSDYSGEVGSTSATEKFEPLERNNLHQGSSPQIEIDPILGRLRNNRGNEIQPASHVGLGGGGATTTRTENVNANDNGDGNGVALGIGRRGNGNGNEPVLAMAPDGERKVGLRGNGNANANGVLNRDGNGHGTSVVAPVPEQKEEEVEGDVAQGDFKVNLYPEGEEPVDGGGWPGPEGLKCRLTENPGFVSLFYYGLQHYLSLAGSLVLIPIVMVPAMGGTDKDTATVISTMLFISGITTILHSYFGTRLPLVQGSSFVYLAPALVIANAQEYRNLTEHKFKHIMRELQGAIIIGSIFQSLLGFSGLMSLLVRLINPIVVAPTVTAVGLAFFSYGFPQAGTCIEISIPLIALVLIFTLYLRGISIFGRHLFRIYAVPLSAIIIWIYASFLTAGGAYNYKGCDPNIPSSNILFRTCIIMVIVSLVATVDSVGTYRTTSLQVNLRSPTPGVVSRGIALEGFCSILAGIWGSGTGSTTLTENMHTIDITKVANRRVVELGGAFLILFSFMGKVGALLASIPLALAASILCFMWALTAALGLSTLQYSQSTSFRNTTIVGVSLFLGMSIPSYFQQYQPESSLILPSYLVPYAAASNGPFHSGFKQLDFAINALMSMNMVVTMLVAFILDNTVPGSQQERGVYVWSRAEDLTADPSLPSEYSLPKKLAWCCCGLKCLGA
ncbi:hypothetical protein PIB30_048915 [Stylosanthes scabra]|uniref:Nucleobase-ascorbate transporter 11 n=1 Tax=Stylosanthes scabra TaxID=79078 RepID=A0ABU6VFK3_9FABA|nr:hypothetical protein [Stylosanthes scabra]